MLRQYRRIASVTQHWRHKLRNFGHLRLLPGVHELTLRVPLPLGVLSHESIVRIRGKQQKKQLRNFSTKK